MHGMVETNSPCIVNRLPDFLLLVRLVRFSPRCGPMGITLVAPSRKKNSCAAECHFCHVMCKVANRMSHGLIFCSDAAGCSIIVRSKVCSNESSFAGSYNFHQWITAFFIHDDLCGFHHRFHFQCAGLQGYFLFQ